MGYRVFSETTTFDAAIDSSIYTAEACSAQADPAVSALAKPLDKLLAQEGDLRAASRKAGRALIRANARVRVNDAILDQEVAELDKDLLAEVRQDKSAPLYVAFFPHASARETIAMTLAPELEEVDRMLEVLAKPATPDALRKMWTKRLSAIAAQGRDALADRKAAVVAQAEASASCTRWIELADRARRALNGALASYGASHGEAHDFEDRFFPGAPNPSKKKARKPAGGNPSPTG